MFGPFAACADMCACDVKKEFISPTNAAGGRSGAAMGAGDADGSKAWSPPLPPPEDGPDGQRNGEAEDGDSANSPAAAGLVGSAAAAGRNGRGAAGGQGRGNRRSHMVRNTGEEGSGVIAPSAASQAGCPPTSAALRQSTFNPQDVLNTTENEVCLFGISVNRNGTAFIEPEFTEKGLEFLCPKAKSSDELRAWLSAELGTGVACRKGKKPEQPNQDNCFLCFAPAFIVCGIADGHGQDGHWASHWLVRMMLRLLLLEVTETGALPNDAALDRIFDTAHEGIRHCAQEDKTDLQLSGSTLSICVIERKTRSVVFAWVGDSRCVAGCMEKNNPQCKQTTGDHKPQDPEERRRITSSGGEVVRMEGDIPHRVFVRGKDAPGLAMSRAMGDLTAHSCGVIHKPGIKRFVLEPDQFVLCASDGVWEFMKNSEVVKMIATAGRAGVLTAVQALVKESRDRWIREEGTVTDDISAIAIWL